jgi:hypothetical protein
MQKKEYGGHETNAITRETIGVAYSSEEKIPKEAWGDPPLLPKIRIFFQSSNKLAELQQMWH